MGLAYAKFHPSAAFANRTCSHSGGRSVPECYSTALGPTPSASAPGSQCIVWQSTTTNKIAWEIGDPGVSHRSHRRPALSLCGTRFPSAQ